MKKLAKSTFPRPVYIDAAVRSPIGKFGGALTRFSAPQLAGLTLAEGLRRRTSAPRTTDWVLLGHARQAGAGPNPARQATLLAGLPESTPALTLNQACASGLSAIVYGLEKICLGRAESIWAGGVESMSNTPYLLPDARWGRRLGHGSVVDGMNRDGFHCPMANLLMGQTVENFLVPEFQITRSEQDALAAESQRRAALAWNQGLFLPEVFNILPEGRQPGLSDDEHRRADSTKETLAKLQPVFDPQSGTLTAGNSSGITDGAAFVHLSPDRSPEALAEILDYEFVALDPRRMGLGPVEAVQRILKRQQLQITDLSAVELNEAFAAQVIACQRELKIPEAILNAWGGAIALGHPIGATGARITVTLLSRLRGQSGALGLATLCVSGGQGAALLLKAL